MRVALDALEPRAGARVVVAYGDMPLVPEDLFAAMTHALDGPGAGGAMALVTARMPLPSNFGRIVRRGDEVERIVEERDATPDQRAIDEMNAGIYAFDEDALREAITQLRNDNAQSEYYLTDTVAYFTAAGKRVRPVVAPDHRTVLGINDRVELATRAQGDERSHLRAPHA